MVGGLVDPVRGGLWLRCSCSEMLGSVASDKRASESQLTGVANRKLRVPVGRSVYDVSVCHHFSLKGKKR